ncbi:MAG: hypothetical protein GC191_09210 [Azospirillum sp.]|nr:hypothetical protein [Azospirillum sp.]
MPESFTVTLTEFCARASATDKRVELLAGFYRDENAAGRVTDDESAYRARLAAFIIRPSK